MISKKFKSGIFNRAFAAAAAAVILFVTVFSASVFANAADDFSPRLSAPASTNSYYYGSKNIYYSSGWGMPNCTAYAYGRAYEILGSKPNLCTRNAEKWYDYNKDNGYYSYGKTPKLGAIACWSYSGGGHVAVVEKIENGTITFSNSEYGGRTFYLTTADIDDDNAGGRSFWTFQGYIYIGDFGGGASDKPSTLTEGTYRVSTDGNSILNLRSSYTTSSSVVAKIPNNTLIEVTQIKQQGGYTWGYTSYNGKNGWAALDYCVFVSGTDEPAATEQTTQPATTKPATQPTTQPAATVPATEPESYVKGDVNLDGHINILDVTLIQCHLSQQRLLEGIALELADYSGSNGVDISDATLLQKYLVGE